MCRYHFTKISFPLIPAVLNKKKKIKTVSGYYSWKIINNLSLWLARTNKLIFVNVVNCRELPKLKFYFIGRKETIKFFAKTKFIFFVYCNVKIIIILNLMTVTANNLMLRFNTERTQTVFTRYPCLPRKLLAQIKLIGRNYL